MTYKIAVASSDGVHVDESFGSAAAFDIYEAEGEAYRLSERREIPAKSGSGEKEREAGCGADAVCGTHSGCAQGGGCAADGFASRADLLLDCRCVVCRKIGFQAAKQLERRAISEFAVDCDIREALTKITKYFSRTDNHQSLKGLAKEAL